MNTFANLQNKIRGPVFSIVTPFRKSDDEIDFKSLEKYFHKIYNAGGRIFYVMGYNSRFSELSWSEIKILNTFVVKTVKGINSNNIVIVADPLHCSTQVSKEFAKHAELIGADIISLIFREKLYSNKQVLLHYSKIAKSIGIGVLIHEMPFISGLGGHTVNWPVELLDQLADIENVVAIKEDAKDDEYSHKVISTIKDRVSIIISGGGKRQWLHFANIGCQSWLNGIGVFEPRLAVRFWEAYQKKNTAYINGLIKDIELPFFNKIVNVYGWHLGIKAALEVQGLMQRYERMPLLALNDDDFEIVKRIMNNLPIARYI